MTDTAAPEPTPEQAALFARVRRMMLIAGLTTALALMQGNQVVNEVVTKIKDTTSNPAPLGLMAFGMTTVLLNIHNAGFYPLNTMILAMGICYGGIAQVIVGIMEWKKGNTFGTAAFTSYGLFWLTLVALWLLPVKDTTTAIAVTSKSSIAVFFVMWGIFTGLMFIGTLRLNRALQVVFGSLTILFFLLCIRDATGSAVIATITGYEGIFLRSVCHVCLNSPDTE